MPRWFLSYHSPDEELAKRLKSAIEGKDAGSSVFFAPSSLRAGGAWTAQLADELAKADAFLLLIGEHGVGKWQVPEYDEALDRWVKSEPPFPLVVVLLEGQTAPGLPFLRRLHWIVTPRPGVREGRRPNSRREHRASRGPPSELWRYASPYRGLEAMEEKDSDYFFGRTRETIEALDALAEHGRLPILIGNSGVGKSSLAQAGVLAALKRQAWPGKARALGRLAGGLSEQPAMVLSDAQARRRADQGAGRLLSRRLAVRRDRSRASRAAAWLDQAFAGRRRRSPT